MTHAHVDEAGERDAGPVAVHVAVPLYNNQRTVRAAVEGVLAHGVPVVVVDDGSDDGSADTLSGLDVTILSHDRNRGKGAALLTAARHIRSAGGSHMICFDADGQFDPGDVGLFISAIGQDPRAIYYGVRQFVEGDVPGLSTFGRSWSNLWARITSGKKIRDSQCGFRAYPLDVLLKLRFRSRHFDFEVDALVRSILAGCEPVGIPVAVTYSPPGGRVTHFRLVVDNARITRSYTRLVIRSVMPVPQRVVLVDPDTGEERVLSPWHPIVFLKSLLKEQSSPGRLAAATAVGLFVGTLPIFGLHTLVIVFAATMMRLNRLLAVAVSNLCAPPFVPLLCLEVGYFMRHREWLATLNAETLWEQLGERFLEYVLGSLVVAPLLAVLGGAVTFVLALFSRWMMRREEAKVAAPPERKVTAKYGNRMGIEFFHFVLKLAGLRMAYFFLYFAVPYYVLFRPSLRQRTDPYLKHRFPGHGRLRRTVDAMVWVMAFARSMVDETAVRARGPGLFRTVVPRESELASMLEDERGVILLMSHAGSWRLVISSLEVTDTPVNLLLFRDPTEPTAPDHDVPEMLGPVRIIDPAGAFGGLIEATAALGRGEVVAIMGDRHWGGRTVAVDFFGDMAYVPESPYHLARATGARLIALLVERVGHRQLSVDFHELGEAGAAAAGSKNEVLRAQGQEYASLLQRFLMENPYWWFNFFDFWQPPTTIRHRSEGEQSGGE